MVCVFLMLLLQNQVETSSTSFTISRSTEDYGNGLGDNFERQLNNQTVGIKCEKDYYRLLHQYAYEDRICENGLKCPSENKTIYIDDGVLGCYAVMNESGKDSIGY